MQHACRWKAIVGSVCTPLPSIETVTGLKMDPEHALKHSGNCGKKNSINKDQENRYQEQDQRKNGGEKNRKINSS